MAHTCMAPPLSPPSSPSPLLPTSSLPQDSADSFSVTAKSTTDSDGKPLGRGRKLVPTTIDVLEADNGSCSVLKIQTLDRPGLLVDIVRQLSVCPYPHLAPSPARTLPVCPREIHLPCPS